MHLLASLQSGFADAPGGYARIYSRGTTTAARAYSDFAGENRETTHTLDSRGRVRRYVNELVDVKVFDADGVQVVETFTEGVNATAVEIIHAHVTGTDYATGASGLNKPSTLQRDLDKRYESFGADNYQVLVAGVGRNLKDVLVTSFIDVRGPAYGAKGDGASNDTVPIQAALDAADDAGGGIVFFPPGTYIVDSLTIPSNVSLLGCGAGTTVIQTSSATEVLLVAAGPFVAYGLKLKTTGKGVLRFSAATTETTTFTACAFSCTNAASVHALDGTNASVVTFNGCDFTQTGAGGTKSLLANGAVVNGGSINFASSTVAFGPGINLLGVEINYSAAGTVSLLDNTGSVTTGSLTGCFLSTSGGGTLNVNLPVGFYEYGCSYGASGIVFTGLGSGCGFRDGSFLISSIGSATYTPDANLYSIHLVTNNNAAMGFNTPSPAFAGSSNSRLTIWYKNTNAGAVTPTFSAAYKVSTVPSVASNSACAWNFVYHLGLGAWVQVGSVVAYAA